MAQSILSHTSSNLLGCISHFSLIDIKRSFHTSSKTTIASNVCLNVCIFGIRVTATITANNCYYVEMLCIFHNEMNVFISFSISLSPQCGKTYNTAFKITNSPEISTSLGIRSTPKFYKRILQLRNVILKCLIVFLFYPSSQ